MTFMQWANYIIFKFELTEGALLATFATNVNEGTDFLKILPLWYLLSGFTWIFIHSIVIFKQSINQEVKVPYFRVIVTIGLVLGLLPKAVNISRASSEVSKVFERAYPTRNIIVLLNSFTLQKEFEKDLKQVSLAKFSIANTKRENELHVIVIGESARKSSHSLYGYKRKTNSFTNEFTDDITLFRSPFSSSNSTIMSLKWTIAKKTESGALILPHILKLAGYNTQWISNQGKFGEHLNATTVLANTAGDTVFINNSDFGGVSFDEKVLPKLRANINNNSAQVIFIHLLGSHFHYNRRYPDSYKHFNDHSDLLNQYENFSEFKGDMVNSYDNSIRYTDFVLSEIIKTVKSSGRKSSVTYFSDHGELLFEEGSDFYGHGGGKAPQKEELEVPFFIWTSKDYQGSKAKDSINELARTPQSLTNFIDIMVHFLRIPVTGVKLKSVEELQNLTEIPFYDSRGQRQVFKKL